MPLERRANRKKRRRKKRNPRGRERTQSPLVSAPSTLQSWKRQKNRNTETRNESARRTGETNEPGAKQRKKGGKRRKKERMREKEREGGDKKERERWKGRKNEGRLSYGTDDTCSRREIKWVVERSGRNDDEQGHWSENSQLSFLYRSPRNFSTADFLRPLPPPSPPPPPHPPPPPLSRSFSTRWDELRF